MTSHHETGWRLDARLEADTHAIGANADVAIRLMDDRRWPWIILVPQMPGLCDLDDMEPRAAAALVGLLHRVSAALKEMGVCSSTNVATLSNVVTQMHWHVVGRREGDANWPGPVWGFETRIPYGKEEADRFINDFRTILRA